MAEIGEWFNSIPLITRYWFAGSVVVPLACRLNIFSPYTMLLTSDFLSSFNLWKPITSVLYYPLSGNRGFHYMINLYFLYNYSQRLEQGQFSGRPADYLFMIIFNWLSLVLLALAFGVYMLMDSMIMSVLYVYCIINQDMIVSFWFGTRFKARYLPWALFGVNFLLAGGGMSDLLGIIVGHLYYFVMMKYPAEQGVTLLETPQVLYKYFPSGSVYTAPTERPNVPRSTGAGNPTGAPITPTGYNWGRGRRLED